MPTDPKTNRRDERFTMLEAKEPNNLTEAQKAYPLADLSEEQFVADDLALLKGLINRIGAARLHQLIDHLRADDTPSGLSPQV